MISVKWPEVRQRNNDMRKTIIILTGLFFLICTCAKAQHAHFTKSGTIEFEKRLNMYALIQKAINKDNEAFYAPMLDGYKKNHPQFKAMKSTLSFTDNKTLFVPAEEEMSNEPFSWNPGTHQNNTIYSDLNTGTGVFQKNVFDEKFLVKDSIRKIKWKITDETREIAGYTCRRANGIMLDSIYVVAFYTTEIPVSGGPESFNGLPGMILGVALPHENVTWFATKVTDTSLPPNTVVPPKKGKQTDGKGFKSTVEAAFKDWGSEAALYNKIFSM
jgi:GLPGLI family protein